MASSFVDKDVKRKISFVAYAGAMLVVANLSGCSTSTVENKVEPSAPPQALANEPAQSSVKIIPRKHTVARGKDKHQLEYEQKQRWYHQQWELSQRINEQRQRSQAQATWQAQRSQRADIDYSERLAQAAVDRLRHRVSYNGAYIPIGYPNGDVPQNIGVCTDTVIRSYRRLGVDLQRLVHEDISRAFYSYPNLPKWGLQGPDTNIDHRRVHNLKVFFARHGQRVPVTGNPSDYRPGDLVTWSLGGDQEHIGIVVDQRTPADPRRFMIVHNIGQGEKMEDILFKMPITGHYRYFPGSRHPQLASAQY
ncbi:MAG: DUF1287 domain-containing protein [Thiolinea sp.]